MERKFYKGEADNAPAFMPFNCNTRELYLQATIDISNFLVSVRRLLDSSESLGFDGRLLDS